MDEDSQGQDEQQSARRAPRESLLLMGQLSMDGVCEPLLVRIRNLSATGMMAESSDLPEPGSHVTVEIRNIGAVSGTVAWARTGKFGVAFDGEIDPAEARKPVGSGKGASNLPDFLRTPRAPR